MKIKARRRFKQDCEKLETRLKNPSPFKQALFKAIFILQEGGDLSAKYVINKIPAQGDGWYDCYVFDNIIMIYKIEGQYVKLSRLGTPKELEKER